MRCESGLDGPGPSGSTPGDATERDRAALNAICPYYTMFPLSFPLAQLAGSGSDDAVLDPFCGRGTTLFAARLAGVRAVGVDSNPVAVAISRAKLSAASARSVVRLASDILRDVAPDPAPDGPFWALAYAPSTLDAVLRLRAGLRGRTGGTADALRATVLGALHGPLTKGEASHLSNQMPRTFASKPAYSVRYWTRHAMAPPAVDALAVIRRRAARYFSSPAPSRRGRVLLGDARDVRLPARRFSRVVTSPPYFGMRTYLPDQWLRDWFIGGAPFPTYVQRGQIGYEENATPAGFAGELGRVWDNVAPACRPGARMVVRFGSIGSRPCDPLGIIRSSIEDRGGRWRIESVQVAGDAHGGRRQADHMGPRAQGSDATGEYDIVCSLIR